MKRTQSFLTGFVLSMVVSNSIASANSAGAGNEMGETPPVTQDYPLLPSGVFYNHLGYDLSIGYTFSELVVNGPLNVDELAESDVRYSGVIEERYQMAPGRSYNQDDLPLIPGGVYEFRYSVTDNSGYGYDGEDPLLLSFEDDTAEYNELLISEMLDSNFASDLGTPRTEYVYNKARLLKVDLDIVHPATGELDEAKEDVDDGGYVAIKREVDQEDVAPVTQLKLHANSSLPNTAKFRLKFADGGRYKIYSDETRQTLVESEVTEFDVGNPTTLYFQGLSKSESRGGGEVMMQIGTGGNWYDGDSVKCTVVQSEFPVVIRAFIPYLWSEPEQPASFLDVIAGVLYTVIAEGDNRKAVLRTDSIGVSYRMRQRIVLTPYYDLHSSFDLSSNREETVADLSSHHVKQLSVPLLDLLDKHGDSWDSNGPTVHEEGPPSFTSSSYQKISHVDKTVSFKVVGSGEDGAVPWYIPGAVTPNIDWDVDVSLDAFADPLNPRIAVTGSRDKFPAYEIIFEQSDGGYGQLYFFSPPYSRQPGITTLGFSEEFTTDIITIE